MGGSSSKEEVILAQTASGGNNGASLEKHMGANNIILSIIAIVLLVGLAVGAYYFYKKCHKNWMRELMRNEALSRVVRGSCRCRHADERV